jgi:hypothetical protein
MLKLVSVVHDFASREGTKLKMVSFAFFVASREIREVLGLGCSAAVGGDLAFVAAAVQGWRGQVQGQMTWQPFRWSNRTRTTLG